MAAAASSKAVLHGTRILVSEITDSFLISDTVRVNVFEFATAEISKKGLPPSP